MISMIKFLLNIFNPDWSVVAVRRGTWEITYDDDISTVTEFSYYELLHSKRMNRYKVRCGGYKPKKHRNYRFAIEDFNNIINSSKN